MFSNPRGMAICIGVTGVASILLWFYFKNRIESVESKLDNMFQMIQNFSTEQAPTLTRDEMAYYNEQPTTEDPFESKVLQYENQTTSQQLPTEKFEKEVENSVNNTKLIDVSEDSDESSSESDNDDDENEEGLDLGKVVGHMLEVEIKKDTGEIVHVEDKKIYQATDDEADSLDEVDSDENNSDNEEENIKNIELKEEVKEYSTMKVSELKKLAQGKGLTGYTKLNKAGLVNLLENN